MRYEKGWIPVRVGNETRTRESGELETGFYIYICIRGEYLVVHGFETGIEMWITLMIGCAGCSWGCRFCGVEVQNVGSALWSSKIITALLTFRCMVLN